MMPALAEIARAWWAWMAPMAWQVTVLAAAVWFIDHVARRRIWPQMLHALWLLVLLKLLLPPTFASPMSVAGLFAPGITPEKAHIGAPVLPVAARLFSGTTRNPRFPSRYSFPITALP